MGKESQDIDIALDDMFGAEFAQLISNKLYPGATKKMFGVIKANNEKSKHLETATIKVHGMDIDLVNLRSEKYTDASRIPEIGEGTPEEDAYRRDLTINAMFYNINKQKVEDYTQMGVNDLMHGIVRTPLEPLQTFLDDPLRVLRTIRFATRYDFKIAEDIFAAANDPKVIVR
jgi:tRNA nucleotidyltransferase (CCA-adding enzyme)